MGNRTWIKLYCENWLSGTLREETPELRGIWSDVLALAGSGRYGDIGEIKLADDVGLSDEQIAGILKIYLNTWLECKERLIDTERIYINNDNNCITIINWNKYQSEYDRQKQYRPKGDNPPLTIPPNNKIENRRRIEGEKKCNFELQEEVTPESYNTELQNNSHAYQPGDSTNLNSSLEVEESNSRDKLVNQPNGDEIPFYSKEELANQPTETSNLNIPDKHRGRNLTRLITACLRDNGSLSVEGIRQKIGWPEDKIQSIRCTLSQNKGKVFDNPRHGVWVLI